MQAIDILFFFEQIKVIRDPGAKHWHSCITVQRLRGVWPFALMLSILEPVSRLLLLLTTSALTNSSVSHHCLWNSIIIFKQKAKYHNDQLLLTMRCNQ